MLLFIVVLGVVGTCTWALVEGIRTTDGKVSEFWGIVGQAKTQVRILGHTLPISYALSGFLDQASFDWRRACLSYVAMTDASMCG